MLLAFSLVGLWHQVTPQYLTWGIGHGLLMAGYMTFSKMKLRETLATAAGQRLWSVISWATTMSLVSFLSTFANEPSWAQALNFLNSLLGGPAG